MLPVSPPRPTLAGALLQLVAHHASLLCRRQFAFDVRHSTGHTKSEKAWAITCKCDGFYPPGCARHQPVDVDHAQVPGPDLQMCGIYRRATVFGRSAAC